MKRDNGPLAWNPDMHEYIYVRYLCWQWSILLVIGIVVLNIPLKRRFNVHTNCLELTLLAYHVYGTQYIWRCTCTTTSIIQNSDLIHESKCGRV